MAVTLDWSAPQASNGILSDVNLIQAMLNACIQLSPSGINMPNGSKKLASVTGGVQLQSYNGSRFVTVGKLMHDADSVDGFHASQSATANNVAVRDSSGKLAGDITGNAAGLSATLGTAKGGTGRTDGAAQDIAVPNGSGTGLASALGQVGRAVNLGSGVDLDTLIESGFYIGSASVSRTVSNHYPFTAKLAAALRVSTDSTGKVITQQLMYGAAGAL